MNEYEIRALVSVDASQEQVTKICISMAKQIAETCDLFECKYSDIDVVASIPKDQIRGDN